MVSRRSVLVGVGTLPFGAGLLTPRGWAQTASTQFDYYIGPAGKDSNPGTQSQPWSITAINTKQSTYAGHRVGLLSGTYDVSTLPATSRTVKLWVASGSSGSPTVIQSVTPLAAVISCNSAAAGYVATPIIGDGANGVGATSTPQYITLKGLTITGGTVTGVSFAGTNPKTCYGLIVDSCEACNFVNPNNNSNIGCIAFGTGCVGALVTNCSVHDCYTSGVNRASHGNSSGVHSYDNDLTVQYTAIYGCNNGIYQKNQNATPPPDGMTVRYCYFYAGAGMGPALAGFNNAFGTTPPYTPTNIYNNIFENVTIYSNENDGLAALQADLNFYNNTVHATGMSSLGCWISGNPALVRVSVYNNILVRGTMDSARGDLTLGPLYGSWRVCDYNSYPSGAQFGISASDSVYPTALIALAQWLAVLGAPDVHSLTGDPGFIGPLVAGSGAGQYRLASGSRCIGSGRAGGISSGTPVDMGAWAGVSQIGSNFGPAPAAPVLTVS